MKSNVFLQVKKNLNRFGSLVMDETMINFGKL